MTKIDQLKSQRENPPAEWVILRNDDEDSFSEGEFAKAFCNFIDRFYWRERGDEPNELHVVMRNSNGKNKRYRYFDVPKGKYDEMWNRAYFTEDYGRPFGTWFSQKIKGEYEYENYTPE